MKSGAHDGASGYRRDDFWLSGSDGDQPAGRVMALVMSDQLAEIVSYSVTATHPGKRRSRKLHRYRVALRRAKALLVAAETVFPPLLARSAFEAVSLELQETADLRNLDVLADSLSSWSEYLSPEFHGGLHKISDSVDERRNAGYLQVRTMVESDQHATMIEQLRTLGTVYRLGGEEPGRDVLVKARTVARSSFEDAWARMETAGDIAMDSTDVDDWHRLRRRLKRVGYLIDAMGPILDDADEAQRAKRVRKLLGDLGELQDMAVEAQLIEELGRSSGTKATMAAGAMVNPVRLEIPRELRRSRKRWKKLSQMSTI